MADKVFTFLLITFVMSLLLYFAGQATSNNSVGLVLSILQGNFQDNELWQQMAIVLAGVGLLVASIGLVAGNSGAAITGATVTMGLFLVSYISDIIGVIQTAGMGCDVNAAGLCGLVYWLIVFILAPLALMFAYSLMQFALGGTD